MKKRQSNDADMENRYLHRMVNGTWFICVAEELEMGIVCLDVKQR